jgi:ABC-type multidrug transport system ATPase subunit
MFKAGLTLFQTLSTHNLYRIWHHMMELVSTKQTTIIITTHYIEEARQANAVGLMRDGQLLAESEPNALINSYGMGVGFLLSL